MKNAGKAAGWNLLFVLILGVVATLMAFALMSRTQFYAIAGLAAITLIAALVVTYLNYRSVENLINKSDAHIQLMEWEVKDKQGQSESQRAKYVITLDNIPSSSRTNGAFQVTQGEIHLPVESVSFVRVSDGEDSIAFGYKSGSVASVTIYSVDDVYGRLKRGERISFPIE